MPRASQISAFVSPVTRSLLERHARATGVKKGHLIEQALLHHLRAIEALPADVVVSPRLVVSRSSGIELAKRLTARSKPTRALRALLGDGD